jgi:hypothetical protein
MIAYRIDALYMPYVQTDCSYTVLRACDNDTPAQAGLNHYLHEWPVKHGQKARSDRSIEARQQPRKQVQVLRGKSRILALSQATMAWRGKGTAACYHAHHHAIN